MMRIQHPISRHQSVSHRHLIGKTSMVRRPQHMEAGPSAAHNEARHQYFSMHALAGPQKRTALGNFGDNDNGHIAAASMRGGAISSQRLREPSFGTPSVYGSEMISHRRGPALLKGSTTHVYHPPMGRTAV